MALRVDVKKAQKTTFLMVSFAPFIGLKWILWN